MNRKEIFFSLSLLNLIISLIAFYVIPISQFLFVFLFLVLSIFSIISFMLYFEINFR
jgi:hypothetical protein